jgi:hypothetical protein
VAVIVHERRGTWAAQLRPRLQHLPVRWFETRSTSDLDAAIVGVASPVVVIDLGRHVELLRDLDRVVKIAPGARTLVLDPDSHDGTASLARELGATEVLSGFVPPPDAADRIEKWIGLAAREIDREGWSRPLSAGSPQDSESWLERILKDQPGYSQENRSGPTA